MKILDNFLQLKEKNLLRTTFEGLKERGQKRLSLLN